MAIKDGKESDHMPPKMTLKVKVEGDGERCKVERADWSEAAMGRFKESH